MNQNNILQSKNKYKCPLCSALYNEIVLSDGAGDVDWIGFLCTLGLVINHSVASGAGLGETADMTFHICYCVLFVALVFVPIFVFHFFSAFCGFNSRFHMIQFLLNLIFLEAYLLCFFFNVFIACPRLYMIHVQSILMHFLITPSAH